MLQDHRSNSYWRKRNALLRSTNSPRLFKIGCEPYLTSCDPALGCFHRISINIFQPYILVPLSHHLEFFLITIILSNATGSAIDASVSGITESRVPADQPATIPPIRTATSRRTTLLPPSRLIAGRKIPIFRKKGAAIELQFMIGEHDDRNPPYLLIYRLPGRVIEYLTSHGIWSRTRLLRESSRPTNNHTGLTLSVSVL